MNQRSVGPEPPAPRAGLPSSASCVVGWLDASSTPGRLRVDFPGNTLGPTAARATLVLSDAELVQAVATRQGTLLVFENGDPALPIILGLVQAPEANPFAALLATPAAAPQVGVKRAARLDGESVVLEGQREVVLKCGEATLTLRRDGKIIIRGAYVETHAKGINRIKGGAVKIN